MALKTWQNGGVNNNWSTAGNWLEGSKPAIGDDVIMNNNYNCVLDENTVNGLKSFDQTGYTGIMSGASRTIYITATAGSISGAADNGSGNVRYTTSAVHGLIVGNQVIISGMGEVSYNVLQTITAVPDTTHFESNITYVSNADVTGTWALNNIIKFQNGINHTLTCNLTITSASGTITSMTLGGFDNIITLTVGGNATGQVYFLDNVYTTNTVQHNAGILHTDGPLDNLGLTHSWLDFSNSGTSTLKTLKLGNSTITCTDNTQPWYYSSAYSTLDAGTSILIFTGASISFSSSSASYYDVRFIGSGIATLTGACTFTNLTRVGTATKTDGFSIADNIVVNGILSLQGNSVVNRLLIKAYNSGATFGTPISITLGGSATFATNSSSIDFRDITVLGGALNERDLQLIPGGSGDCFGNTGITFTSPTNWYWHHAATGTNVISTLAKWSTGTNGTGSVATRLPLPQDTLIFDNNSFDTTGLSLTCDIVSCPGFDFSTATNNPTITFNLSNQFIYGDVTLAVGSMTVTGGTTYWSKRPSIQKLTSNGKTWNGYIYVYNVGGTFQLQDNLTCSQSINVEYGTFDSNEKSLICLYFSSQQGYTRTIDITNSTITCTRTSGSAWYITAITGLTLLVSGSTIVCASGTAPTFYGGGMIYNNVIIGGTTGATIYDSNTFNVLTVQAPSIIKFEAGKTQTVSVLDSTGTATDGITLQSTSTAIWYLRCDSGSNIIHYTTLKYSYISYQASTPITLYGSPTVSTVDPKIGTGCLSLNGSTQYLTLADKDDWDISTSDFTIDCWVKLANTTGTKTVWSQSNNSTYYTKLQFVGAQLRFIYYPGSNQINLQSSINVVSGVWTHIAVVRNGTTFKLYIDGVEGASVVYVSSLVNHSGVMYIGSDVSNAYFNGNIDEFRFSNGVSRWTGNFTPQTTAYTTDSYTKLLIHFDNTIVDSSGLDKIGGGYWGANDGTNVNSVGNEIDPTGLNGWDFTIVTTERKDINTDIRAFHSLSINDIDSDIRTKQEVTKDILADIRVSFPTFFTHIDTDIRIQKQELIDILTDIRVQSGNISKDIDTDIRLKSLNLSDINSDIRIRAGIIFEDISTDIRVKKEIFHDINNDVRVVLYINPTQVNVTSLQFEEGPYTNHANVRMLIEATGAVEMQFRKENESNFSAFELYNSIKDITLSPGDGEKTVYVRFKDITGNITDEYSSSIKVITTNPQAVTIEAYTSEEVSVPIIDSVYQNDKNPFFRWQIPIGLEPYTGFSYALDSIPLDIKNIEVGTIIRNGLEVTKVTPMPEMTLNISSGAFYRLSTFKNLADSATLLLENGGVLGRIDLVYLDPITEEFKIEKGTEAVTPIAPLLPENGILLAEVLVPAGTVNIADVVITDKRDRYIKLTAFLTGAILPGQHTLQVKAFSYSGGISAVAIFNLYVANQSPEMGAVIGYTDATKILEIFSNTYQSASSDIYLEWTPAPNEPGPINYYYTTNGNEPAISSSFTTNSNILLGAFSEGYTNIKIKPYDTISGNWGSTKEFMFLYGQPVAQDETLVIGQGGTTLKQSLRQVQVLSISFNFDSARICKIYQPVAFDETLPFQLDEIVTIIHKGETLFSGHIKTIERTITISEEGVTYQCTDARGILTEIYAHLPNNEDGRDSALITFTDEPIQSAISKIVGIVPSIIKRVESYPTGSNVFESYQGQTVEQVLSSLYSKTNYGWYLKPDGTLVSVNSKTSNPGEAKFGVYGTTVNSTNPQYNVIDSNLQFDVSQRYNKVIIEGGIRHVRKTIGCGCVSNSNFQTYRISSASKISKVIKTQVSWRRATSVWRHSYGSGGTFETPDSGPGAYIVKWVECNNNKISYWEHDATGTFYQGLPHKISDLLGESNEFPQGSVSSDKTITFSKSAHTYWWANNSTFLEVHTLQANEVALKQTCGHCILDCLVEDGILSAEVSLAGSADAYGAKTLRIVNSSFAYSEDPENPVNDYDKMIEFANDKLRGLNDIKVNGSLTLDNIDPSWTLDKTVNLINTAQGAWSSLNAKVVGINFNFNQNTTTLELTSEFLK